MEPMNDELLDDVLLNNAYLEDPDVPEGRIFATPGKYRLRFGAVEAKLDKGRSGTREDGSTYSIPVSVQVMPKLTIVEDEAGDTTFAGAELNRFYRLTSEPVKFRGQIRNFSTLSAAMKLVGLEYPHGDAVPASQIIEKAREMEGLETPVAIDLTLRGTFKYKPFYKTADGSRVYLDEKLFRTGDQDVPLRDYDGGWAPAGYLLDPETNPTWTLERPSDNADFAKVFANLEPTLFAWKPRA